MKALYSDQEPIFDPPSIFLAGPTPRTDQVISWRRQALQILQQLGFPGTVLIPERRDWVSSFDYIDQVEWEFTCLEAATVIAFWIPRDLVSLPGFTTNVEFGRYVGSGKCVYGRPASASKNRYLDWLYHKLTGESPCETLDGALRAAVARAFQMARGQNDSRRRETEGDNQMTANDLEDLYDYGYWADRKLFDVISQLTPEEFTRPLAGGYESIRNTMVHILSAVAGWLDRCGGPARGPSLNPVDFPTIESVIQAWSGVEANVRDFLAELKDEDLVRNVEFSIGQFEKLSMPLGELMQHAAIHGVHHRGQVAMLLRLLGRAPGAFDILVYRAVKGAAPVN